MESAHCSHPAQTLQHNLALRDFRRSREKLPLDPYEWLAPSFKQWLSEPFFCLLAVTVPFRSPSGPKDICVDLIQLLQEKKRPVVWLLQDEGTEITAAGILNSLNMQLHNLSGLTSLLSCYTPKMEEDKCVEALRFILPHISDVFIIIDQEIATQAFKGRKDDLSFWHTVFFSHNYQNSVKVAMMGSSHAFAMPPILPGQNEDKSIIHVQGPTVNASFSCPHRTLRKFQSTTIGSVALAEIIESRNMKRQPNQSDHQTHVLTQPPHDIASSTTTPLVKSTQKTASELSEVWPLDMSREARETPRYFELFDNQTASMNVTERADQWFAYLETILYDVIPPIPKKNEDRIRIAILDTGICMTDHYLGLKENRKRITYQSFVKNDPDPNNPIDLSGHGTHAAALLVRVAHNADIYVARISKTEELEDPHQIATAIYYAIDKWGVNIISMSFGFPSLTQDLECIQSAILYAQSKSVVLFAAARNNGGLKKIAYPANRSEVICINSTDGEGNPSHFNPSAEATKNFSVLGEDVLSSWPRSLPQRMSGTSFATPIAAGIAAIVMDYMTQKSSVWSEEDRYIAKRIKTREGIVKVFEKHLSDRRGDFRFICPWKFFNKTGQSELDKVLLNTLRDV